MWKQIADVGKQSLALARDMQQCKAGIAEVRQHDKEQDKRIDELTEAVQQLAFALQHDRDMSARDRENLLLRLENALLRFDRRLSPPDNQTNISEQPRSRWRVDVKEIQNVVLDAGQVVERGIYDELLETNERYHLLHSLNV